MSYCNFPMFRFFYCMKICLFGVCIIAVVLLLVSTELTTYDTILCPSLLMGFDFDLVWFENQRKNLPFERSKFSKWCLEALWWIFGAKSTVRWFTTCVVENGTKTKPNLLHFLYLLGSKKVGSFQPLCVFVHLWYSYGQLTETDCI